MLRTKVVWIPIYKHFLIMVDSDHFPDLKLIFGKDWEYPEEVIAFVSNGPFQGNLAVIIVGDARRDDEFDLAVLVHETEHVLNMMMININESMRTYCDEPQAYLQSFIFVECQKFFGMTHINDHVPRKPRH